MAADPQAVGKVLAEKLVNAEGLAQALGKIWCPIKGVTCKDWGRIFFLFTFHQASGKRRALEDGPWMFGKDLVVMMELDEAKAIEDLEFVYIPIWVRVMKLPFGMMNKVTGEAIGEQMGSFMTMDLDEDGTARGRYLRIKVFLDIRKPLMRGVTVCVGGRKSHCGARWSTNSYQIFAIRVALLVMLIGTVWRRWTKVQFNSLARNCIASRICRGLRMEVHGWSRGGTHPSGDLGAATTGGVLGALVVALVARLRHGGRKMIKGERKWEGEEERRGGSHEPFKDQGAITGGSHV
jgi:hypothetical protein